MYLRQYLKRNKVRTEEITKAVEVLHNICSANTLCTGCIFNKDADKLGNDCILRNFKDIKIVDITEQLIDRHLNCGYMQKIANMLGVNMYEPFKIHYSGFYLAGCVLTDDGFMMTHSDERYCADSVFRDLLIGKAKVLDKGAAPNEPML